MGYPKDLLRSRAVIRPGMYAIIPPEGRVCNIVPGFENCRMTVLCSPKLGAGFVQFIGTADPGGGTAAPYAAHPATEAFIYILDGKGSLTVRIGDRSATLHTGGYAYAPAGSGLSFRNEGDTSLRFLLYKQTYIPHPDPAEKPWTVFGNVGDITERIYDDMANVFIRDLLPVDERFDMNMHILSFEPGASHGYVETHVQEHGAYLYEGEGIYMLDEDWIPVKAEDFIWMGPFCRQCCYGVGRTRLSYIYSKDCNRDPQL